MQEQKSIRWYERWSLRTRILVSAAVVVIGVVVASAFTEVLWGCDGFCSLQQCSPASPCIHRLGIFRTGNVCGIEGAVCDVNVLTPDCLCRTTLSLANVPSCSCRMF